jgi:uncharacterized protein (DUF952 family)
MTIILHITTLDAWQQAQQVGEYRAASLASEGFIHCSRPDQVERPANMLYRGQNDLVLLCIDPARLRSRLVYEATSTPDPFPHIYGPLNLDAVLDVIPFPPGADGSFALPQTLRSA